MLPNVIEYFVQGPHKLPMRRFAVKIQAAIGKYVEVLTIVKNKNETKMIWPRLKVFWFSKDNSTGHSERKKKKR